MCRYTIFKKDVTSAANALFSEIVKVIKEKLIEISLYLEGESDTELKQNKQEENWNGPKLSNIFSKKVALIIIHCLTKRDL